MLRVRHGSGMGFAQHRGMDTSSGDSTEKSKFEKVESFAFKKFETFIILCVALAIGAREAAAMSAGQAAETRQILEETRQNRQDSGNSGSGGDSEAAAESRSGMENRPVAHDNEVTTEAMTQIADAAPLTLPHNLKVPANMRPTLMRMLQRSATFRRQIATLTRKPAVRISVAYGGMRGDRNYHALSTVKKHEWGAMVVDTTIYVPTDLVEIIVHELEHVCEQVEGVDLPTLSRRRGGGVYNLNGHYETARAIRAGQNATREYQGGSEFLQQTVSAPY
jgi:hypothetical protein